MTVTKPLSDTTTRLTHGQLFAGIGGFGLSAQWAGIENVWANEIDGFCCKVLRKNFPNLTIYEGDIRELGQTDNVTKNSERVRCNGRDGQDKSKVRGFGESGAGGNEGIYRTANELPYVSIISGGFPCQPFSHAGKRGGTNDDRYLWPEMLRVIRQVGPRWVIGENVAGLQSMENGGTLERILSEMEDIGYSTETFSIPACGVGAWHRRQRIWIVARSKEYPSHTNANGERSHREKIVFDGEAEFRNEQECESGQVGENVSNSGSQGLEAIERKPGDNGKERPAPERSSRQYTGQTQSGLGDLADGLPSGLAGYWDREPPDIPRVTKKSKHRKEKLMGLGNAIVPQVAFEIFEAIQDN